MRYTDEYIKGLDEALKNLVLGNLKGRSCLVTGASGLIGSALCDMLLRANMSMDVGMDLYFAGRSIAKLNERFAYWLEGTWTAVEYDALKQVDFDFHSDFIFHCASNAHPRAYVEEPVETIIANVRGTANMLEYARRTCSKRLLYVSSSEVYGTRNAQDSYKESDCYPVDLLNPRSCYPNSKRTCETLCAAYKSEYGVESVVVRPGHVYGPTVTATDSRAHAQFAREASCGSNIVMKSPGSQLRSYIYSTDCAAAFLTVMLRGVAGEAYNVGDPHFVCTIRELAEAFALAGGVDIVDDFPSDEEKRGYNMMSCSALDCSKLAALDFVSKTTMNDAAALVIAGLN